MKHHYYLLAGLAVVLSACNPLGSRQQQVKDYIAETDAQAQAIHRSYTAEVRQIKPYTVYRYRSELTDPFRSRDFIISEAPPEVVVKAEQKNKRCEPPRCVPPVPHDKSILEDYSLSALEFVGTLGDEGLVKTPDYGIVSVRIGEYMGKNDGKILAIKEAAIILQEKIYRSGIWEDKKTVLTIRE